jgi:hypothetical protein
MGKQTKYTVLRRVSIPFLLVMVVAASLWFASPQPAKALSISINVPGSGTLGQTYSFTTTVTVEDQDLLPIDHIDMEMHGVTYPAYVATCANLPLNNGEIKSYTSAQTGGGAVTVTAATGTDWGYGYGYRMGYGPRDPDGQGYYYFGYGYGYGYRLGQGTVSITYSVTWTPPTSWLGGNYNVKVLVYGDGTRKFSGTSTSFSLTPPSGGGGGGGGGGAPSPGCNSLTPYMNASGVFTVSATPSSADGNVRLTINAGTKARTSLDTLVTQICILKMTDPPAPPADTQIIGLVYDINPDGATFDPSITLTFTYDPAQVPGGVDPKGLVLATWDSTTGKWIEFQNCTVDTTAHTISVQISHFTPFAIIAHTKPAAFTVSGLTISPTQVDTGQVVTISVQVTNNGDLAGSYSVSLKVNNVVVATRDVSMAGGTTRAVEFTVTQDAGGTYSVDVNGLTGTFTVKPPPTPATFTTSNLSIAPAAADIGEMVTISVLVTNDGDLSGTYRVTTKVDGVALPSKDITVAGHTSQQVTFTTSKSVAGTYTVTIDGQSGTFTVKPALPPPPTTVINWWLIGGIIAGVVVIAVLVSLAIRRRAM